MILLVGQEQVLKLISRPHHRSISPVAATSNEVERMC